MNVADRLSLNPEKMELLWSGSRHNPCRLGGFWPAVKLSSDTVKGSGHVRVLGVTNVESDLSLEKHASAVSSACFFISGKFVVSDNHWTLGQQQHSFTHLSHLV